MPNTLIWIPKRLVELGLVNVAARSPEAFIDYCEQDYAARVEHAAACVRESGAHVVMLTGPSASGKTTTAHKLGGTALPPMGGAARWCRWTIFTRT